MLLSDAVARKLRAERGCGKVPDPSASWPRLRHVNENTVDSSHFRSMMIMPLELIALKLLRQALNADADPAIARAVVLRKLSGLYRTASEDELRNALARAWALHRRDRRLRVS